MTNKSFGNIDQLPDDIVCLGFDYGFSSTGVAVGQSITHTATPLKVLKMNRYRPDWLEVEKLLKTWQPHVCVVGMPLNVDGTKQKISIHAEKFAHQLAKKFSVAVVMVDERYSTVAAREELFGEVGYKGLTKTEIDCYAAKLLIEQWFQEIA